MEANIRKNMSVISKFCDESDWKREDFLHKTFSKAGNLWFVGGTKDKHGKPYDCKGV